jgi:hypothetical protein
MGLVCIVLLVVMQVSVYSDVVFTANLFGVNVSDFRLVRLATRAASWSALQ